MPGPPVINYVRIPVVFSLLLLMAFFPLILGLSEPEYHRASGLATQPYLWRWLAVTGVLFAGSAVIYALRWRRAAARARKQQAAAARAREQQAALASLAALATPEVPPGPAPTRDVPAPPATAREVPAPPAARDEPSPAPPSSFDVWHPARPTPDPGSADPD